MVNSLNYSIIPVTFLDGIMETIRNILSNLKFFSSGESRYVIFSVGAGIGVAVGLVVWYNQKNCIPNQWRRVGELSDLLCFPVKSCGVVRENELECNYLGLQKGTLRDRLFMLINLNGQFITGRQEPKLVKISPVVRDKILTLTAPGMMDHVLDFEGLEKKSTIRATIWGEKVRTVDCGEEVAKWFSRFLLSEDTGFRLVYYPYGKTTRDIRLKNVVFGRLMKSDSGALHDTTNFNVICESSVADLNTRLEEPVTPQHFRPNFVIKGSQPYDEDNWNYVKIGKTAVFQSVKPSIRCNSINVDPETGIRNKNNEPLKTLKKYRQIYDPVLRPQVGECPVMGLNLGLRVSGPVKLGDPVYVSVDA